MTVWLVGPSPPRAYPARGAPLARAPFAVRKGRGIVWLVGPSPTRICSLKERDGRRTRTPASEVCATLRSRWLRCGGRSRRRRRLLGGVR